MGKPAVNIFTVTLRLTIFQTLTIPAHRQAGNLLGGYRSNGDRHYANKLSRSILVIYHIVRWISTAHGIGTLMFSSRGFVSP